MTLGEFREITRGLPDNAEFVNDIDIAIEFTVDIRKEYYKSEADGSIYPGNVRIFIDQDI